MIRTWRHKGLKELFEKGRSYTIHINGPWCITFEFHDGEALRVDLEQYH